MGPGAIIVVTLLASVAWAQQVPCPSGANAPAVSPSTLVGDAQASALGIRCDGNTTLAGGDCVVGGLHVDRGCTRWSPAQLTEVAAAIRDVRGAHGVGCVQAINPALASALQSTMSRNPPVDFCCDQCNGRPDTSVSASQCASTFRPDGSQRTTAVVFSSAVLGTGVCGSQRYEQPLRGALLHELTHAAGVAGVNEHNASGVPDPEALHPEGQLALPGAAGRGGAPLQTLDQRNFVPDPVYGCQNSCYGRAAYQSATSCLACASAVPDPAFAASQNGPGGENAVSGVLATRIYDLESRLAGGGSGAHVPAACQALWNRAVDPGRNHFRASTAARAIQTNGLELERCLAGRPVAPPVSQSLSEFLAPCAAAAAAVRDACVRFAAPDASGCHPTSPTQPSPFHTQEIVETCRDLSRRFQDHILRAMNARRGIAAMASQFAEVRCADYFPSQTLCPRLSVGLVNEHAVSECEQARPAPQ